MPEQDDADTVDDLRDRVQAQIDENVALAVTRIDQELGERPRLAVGVGLTRKVLREQGLEQIGLAASGAAFWLVISVLPTAIAAVSLFGLVVSPERVASDVGALGRAAPGSAGELLSTQLRHVAATSHGGLTVGLIVSLILATWTASAGIYNLDRAVRDAYDLPHQRYAEARFRAFLGAFTVVVGVGAIALITSAALAHSPTALSFVTGIPIAFVAITAGVCGLYRFAVGQPMQLRNVLPGAVASAIGIGLLLTGFGIYASFSTHYTAVYGSLAGAVVAMLTTYLSVYVVLLGAVLNVEMQGPLPTAEQSSTGP